MRVCTPKTVHLILAVIIILYSNIFAGWSPPVRISQPGDCWGPQIIASGDTLHVVYENTGERYDKISYVRSTDGGQSWSTPVRLTERGGATYFPRIVQNSSKLMVLWKEVFYTGYDVFNIGYSISFDNGITWDTAQYIFNPNWQHILYFAAANYDSTVVLAISSQVAYDLIYYSLHSSNFGASWSVPQEMFACYQSLDVDCEASQGLVGLSWDGRFDSSHNIEIYYTGSTNGGANWSDNIALSDTDGYHSQIPAIDIEDSNSVTVCWMDFKYAPQGSATGDIFLRRSHNLGQSWGNINELVYNHEAFKSDLAVSGDTIDLVWDDETNGTIHASILYRQSTNGGTSWSEPVRLDNTDYESRDPAIATCCGKKFVVWGESVYPPDSMGLFFSYWSGGSDMVENGHDRTLPDEIAISAYPNPFNSSTTLSISNGRATDIFIYDITGRQIATLYAKEGKAVWGASAYSSGIYFAKALDKNKSLVIKLIYLK